MEQLSCPRGHIIGIRDCGYHQAIVYRCKTVLCPDCERIRAAKATAAWQPTLERLPNLKSLTLTIKNGGQLKERLKVLDAGFRRLLDFRIGRNNRYKIRRTVATAIDKKIERGKLTRDRGDAWLRQIDAFLDFCERRETRIGKSFKFRKLLKGITSLEVTYNEEMDEWHPHRHLILSMRFVPQVLLETLWRIATNGEGRMVHIRQVTDTKSALVEAIKYVTKMWELPAKGSTTARGRTGDSIRSELLEALHRKKRLWVIGKIKPHEKECKCPGCKNPNCKFKKEAVLTERAGETDGHYQKDLMGEQDNKEPHIVEVYRDDQHRLTWIATRLSDFVLSPYSPSVLKEGDGDHDPPKNRGEPMQTSPVVNILELAMDF